MADDDEDDRDFVKKAWMKSRAINDLRFVQDGEELMDYLHRRGQYAAPTSAPRPGIILLDLNMPRKDGREALKEIKESAELRQIPVVVMTTSEMDEDIYRSYDLGASSYITKPVTFVSLLEVIQIIGRYWVEIVELPLSQVEV
jgi:CheY-like chemotaxis protein